MLQHVLRAIKVLVDYVDVMKMTYGHKAHGQCIVTKVFVKLNSHTRNAFGRITILRSEMDHFVGIKKDILNAKQLQVICSWDLYCSMLGISKVIFGISASKTYLITILIFRNHIIPSYYKFFIDRCIYNIDIYQHRRFYNFDTSK